MEGGGWYGFAAPLSNAHPRLAGTVLLRPLQSPAEGSRRHRYPNSPALWTPSETSRRPITGERGNYDGAAVYGSMMGFVILANLMRDELHERRAALSDRPTMS